MALIKNARRRRAVILIEMALVLPLLILLVFALMEYGWLFISAQHLTNAARHGARLAAIPDATTSEVTTQVGTLMSQAGLGSSGYVTTITPADVTAPHTGETIKVEVAVPYANIALFNFPIIPTPATLRASVTMVKEGP